MSQPPEYEKVDAAVLQEGMLLDRPLSIFLKKNDKYVVVAREFQPLEGRILEKIRKQGEVYSSLPSVFTRYPYLQTTATEVNKICGDDDLAPFEKSSRVRDLMQWLVPCIFRFTRSEGGGGRSSPDLVPGVFLIINSFDSPSRQTLQFLSEISLAVYEDSLKIAACAGILALWLEYCDVNLIRRLVMTVFCAEVGAFSSEVSGRIVDAILRPAQESAHLTADETRLLAGRYQSTLDMIRGGKIPGVEIIDHRLGCLISSTDEAQFSGDPLAQVVSLARWLSRLGKPDENLELPWQNRSFQKICESLELSFFEEEQHQREAA